MFDMKFWLVTVLVLIALLPLVMTHVSFAEKGTFVDEVKFIQYLDENTALEEVRNGNLDMYYFRVSSDRIETEKAREGIQVFESTGGSYSILLNPSISETFNPFSITEIRFALNYLMDRNLIVNELMEHLEPKKSWFSMSDFPHPETWWWSHSWREVRNEWLVDCLTKLPQNEPRQDVMSTH